MVRFENEAKIKREEEADGPPNATSGTKVPLNMLPTLATASPSLTGWSEEDERIFTREGARMSAVWIRDNANASSRPHENKLNNLNLDRKQTNGSGDEKVDQNDALDLHK